jgi:outer membrane protein OmpA-like peptidoglycan-associated protein
MKKIITAITCLSVSACAGHLPSTDKDELASLHTAIQNARNVGAEKCAPVELAKAEAKQLYAAHEIEEHGGYNVSEADELIASGIVSAKAAEKKCSKSKPVVKPAPKPVVKKVKPVEVIKLEGVYFENNSAALKASSEVSLNHAVEVLKKRKDIRVEVAAYTDSRGKDSYNQQLSELRANSVKAYLISHGIAGNRISSHGYGEANPVAENNTKEGRAKNRRVELRVQ